jgi:type II secretion system protein I
MKIKRLGEITGGRLPSCRHGLSLPGFTLVEAMLAITILCVGIVMILKSFFSVAGAFGYTQDRLAAIGFLDAKMAEMKEAAVTGGEPAVEMSEGKEARAGKEFSWAVNLSSVKYGGKELSRLKEARIDIFWKESGIQKNESLVFYLESNG